MQLQVQKVNWWHERFADWLLANPDKSVKDAAKEFNCSVQTLYIIKNSDSFQIYWATRSGDFSNALQSSTIEAKSAAMEKAAAVAEQALDEIGRRIETIGEVMPMGQLIDISNMGLKSLGYGTKGANNQAPNVTVNFGAVDPAMLERARERLRSKFPDAKPEEPRQLEVTDVLAEQVG